MLSDSGKFSFKIFLFNLHHSQKISRTSAEVLPVKQNLPLVSPPVPQRSSLSSTVLRLPDIFRKATDHFFDLKEIKTNFEQIFIT